MNKNPKYIDRPRNPVPRDASIILAIVFFVGIGVTFMLTLGGVHALVQLVSAADGIKSSVIASVLGLGLVVLGPVLLWALAVILPRWWFRDVKNRVRKLFHTRVRRADS